MRQRAPYFFQSPGLIADRFAALFEHDIGIHAVVIGRGKNAGAVDIQIQLFEGRGTVGKYEIGIACVDEYLCRANRARGGTQLTE